MSGLYGKHKALGGNEPEQVPFTSVADRQRTRTRPVCSIKELAEDGEIQENF